MSKDLKLSSVNELITYYKLRDSNLYDLLPKNPEYLKIIEQKAIEAGIEYNDIADLDQVEILILQDLLKDVLSILTDNDAARIKNEVGIGLINSGQFRARIIKKDDKYAILINYGLLTFINQCTKYSIASNEPQYVIFCSEKDPEKLTINDFDLFFNTLIHNYRTLGIPIGPLILLDKDADLLRNDKLYVKELFIVCHELSHYLLGHLEGRQNGVNRDYEYHADVYAFQILEEVLNVARPWLSKKFVLLSLIDLFKDMQFLSGPIESESHPFPYSRISTIANTFYGEDLSNALKNSLLHGDHTNFEKILDTMPNYPHESLSSSKNAQS